MAFGDDTDLYGLGQGCPVHGDERMRECHLCGTEFCAACHRGYACPDCAADEADNAEEELDDDFEDVKNLRALLGDDDEADKLVEEEGELRPGDLADEGADEKPA